MNETVWLLHLAIGKGKYLQLPRPRFACVIQYCLYASNPTNKKKINHSECYASVMFGLS